jgi:DNA-directed RNA polymerase specialized sigma24 family protein
MALEHDEDSPFLQRAITAGVSGRLGLLRGDAASIKTLRPSEGLTAATPLDLRTLFDAHYASIWRLLRRLGVRHEQLDDASQEVFWVAARRLRDIRAGSEHAFLYGVALRVASDTTRRRYAEAFVAGSEPLENLAIAHLNPEEHLERRRALELLDLILDRLPLEGVRAVRARRVARQRHRRTRRFARRYREFALAACTRGVLFRRPAHARAAGRTKGGARMTPEPTDMDDFERSLLEAGRLEAPPSRAATELAWRHFNADGSRLALSGAGGAGPARLTSSNLSWLATGLVAGSVATAALTPSHDERQAPATQPAMQTAAPVAAPPHEVPSPSELAPPPRPPAADPATALPRAKDAAAIERMSRPTAASTAARRTLPASRRRGPGLEAEVQALDAIQGALSSGLHADAIAKVELFHREFPRAQLAADAEGLAIEALLARGDDAAAAERATRFVKRFPGDPHVARFARLVAEDR